MKAQQKLWMTSLLLLAVFLLAACGNNSSNANTASPSTSSSPSPTVASTDTTGGSNAATNSGENETREFEHGKGVTVIPANPERVVAIQYTGAMLALGVKPVGADNEWAKYPLLEQEWAGIEHVGDPWTGLNLEKIVELNPDLIVTHVEDTYEALSKIAPTIWIPWLQYDPPGQIALFGDILGKQAEAEAWQKQFDAKVAETKQTVGSIIGEDKTVTIFNIRPANQFIYGNKAMGGYVIYDLLGLKAPEIVQQEVIDKGLGQLEISLELLPQYANSDYVFLSVLANDGGTERAAEVTEGAIWKNLPASENNRVFDLNWDTYFTTDPLSTMKQLDAFAELLQATQQ
ncbi:ABC transporter substrate-binding protein [Paenibacillus sp. PAMC21692]|uniref:ABC transporter substrate-binding protein n=1 Tax=Paenibacillus sp. PAMC21692 TaxID=2762320 RepID=UPI00164E747D|nr:ABC transporter substrate-binding protein [Paenibacillus sp. PAMC21692]QNK56885.1 ABC transporter substrate-binding protein [Paenibacillus sp. PAMC21692]